MLVFIAHANIFPQVPGGFGVTIFFFLSGYLITTLMRLEIEATGQLSFKKFYLRRIYRIFPPLYIVLVISLLFVYFGIIERELTFPAVAAQFLHFTNYYSILVGNDNFTPGTAILWSLAVEEHFYAIFPLLFLFLVRNMNYRQTAAALLFICMLVLIWRLHLVYNMGIMHPYTYKATDARFDSIAFGCIMGVFSNPALGDKEYVTSEKMKIFILIIAFSILGFCLIYRSPEFRESIRYTLQGIALFPIFYLAISRSHWPIFSWLNWRPVKFMGLISYTFYLSHLLGLHLARDITGDNAVMRTIIGFCITAAFCTFMYIYIEKYFSRLRKKLHN